MELVVVVPTRNRADLAPGSIDSLLADGDPRLRVLVSDNSTDVEQAARLEQSCEERAAERVRYIRAPEQLPMTAHWQWALERVLEDTATTHVLYISDRRLLRPGAMTELLAIAERYPADVVTFADDTLIDDTERPTAVLERPWTGALLRVDSGQLLRVSARGMWHVAVPRMLNSIVPRAVIEDVEQVYGEAFASIAPDHCLGYRLLDRVDTVLYLDRVLVVQRAMRRSNGYSQMLGIVNADHEDFLRELRGRQINERTPVPELLTVTNAAYNEYEYVRTEPASRKLKPLTRHFYLGANARDVERLADPQLRERMRRVLKEAGWSRRMRARYLLALGASAAGYYVRHPLALARQLRRRPQAPARFDDATRALVHALEYPSARTDDTHHLWPLLTRPGVARAVAQPSVTPRGEAPGSGPRSGHPIRGRTTAGR